MGPPDASLESFCALAMIHPAIDSLHIMIKLILCVNLRKDDCALTCPLILGRLLHQRMVNKGRNSHLIRRVLYESGFYSHSF
jgi:hypothetical protein